MKIALLTDGIYPYAMGGMQKHSFYLAKYFALNKVNVDLYHFSQNPKYDISQLEFFTAEERAYINSYIIPFPKAGKLPGHYLRESLQYSTAVYNALKKNAPVDFIYAQGFAGWKIIDAKRKGEKLPPLGINFHGMEPFQKAPGLKAKLQQQLLKKAMLFNLKHADVVFSLGGNLSHILQRKGIPNSKIIQIPIGLEEDWINQKIKERDSVLKFVFVGRYERRKGIEELNKAILSISSRHQFEFHFIGPIPDSKKIKASQVIYHGSISEQDKIKSVLRSCDVLVCPSYAEGMPTVILEAFASGLAAIATNVGAVNELVSDKTGWLISVASVKTISKALVNAMEEPASALQIKKQNAQALIHKNHFWSSIIEKTIASISTRI
jgi:glycosyltransferase involved in cell wall biosynthesis